MRVYLDHNATTPLRPEARARFLEVADGLGGNPSSPHASGRRARAIVDDARAQVAAALGVHEEEIFFTSGATEGNNLVLFGLLEGTPGAGLVTAPTEHSSVLEPARELARRGHPVEWLAVDGQGRVDPAQVEAAAARPGVRLVSLAAANNETGVVLDLEAVTARRGVSSAPPWLHVDAVQALGRIPFHLRDSGVQLATFSGHKLGGPPGQGILWRARGVPLAPRNHGGGQEGGLRPGTENVPGIAATALAVELAVREQPATALHTTRLARALWSALAESLPDLRLLGPPIESKHRLPNTLCVLVPGSDGKVLATRLDLAGLEVSAGSACASGSIEPSHVLLAMGLAREAARSGVRISLGRNTTMEECKRALAVFRDAFSSSRAT